MCALDLNLTRVGGEVLGSRVVREKLVSKDGADIDVQMRKRGGVLEAEACWRKDEQMGTLRKGQHMRQIESVLILCRDG